MNIIPRGPEEALPQAIRELGTKATIKEVAWRVAQLMGGPKRDHQRWAKEVIARWLGSLKLRLVPGAGGRLVLALVEPGEEGTDAAK